MSETKRPLWSGRFTKPTAVEVMALSRSIEFDRRLWEEEIEVTGAHARALERANLLTQQERESIENALGEAARAFERGVFEFDPADEDIHSAIERFLISVLGDVGAKVHAGRSRNDLVVTDLRLWLKKQIRSINEELHQLIDALNARAVSNADVLCPGYTHLQRAQPVLLPHLLLAHAFALGRDFERMSAARKRADICSLGAGAFAGTTLALDPEATASDLGFAGVFDNAADAVSDRDFALEFLSAAAILGVHLSRLGEDVVVWTSAEFGFASLDDAYATGSSIMPQKKNADVAELARAKSARITSDLVHLLGVMKGLPLAYNRDLQEDKEAVFDAADSLSALLPPLAGLVSSLTFHKDRMLEAAGAGGVAATDLAEALVRKGIAFRKAHEAVGRLVASALESERELADLTEEDFAAAGPPFDSGMASLLDPRRSVQSRNSHGGTSPDQIAGQLARVKKMLDRQRRWLEDSV